MALPLTKLQSIYYIAGIAGILATALIPALFKAGRWIFQQIRHVQETRDFVVALHSNHLPHVLHALKLICEKLDIELTEPPPVPELSYAKNDK